MDQFLVSAKSIPIRGLTRSPVRGIFSSQRLHDLVGMQDAVRARDLQHLANSLSSAPQRTDWSLTGS
jgi:hypothetical protein